MLQMVRVSVGDTVTVQQFQLPHASFEIALLTAEVGARGITNVVQGPREAQLLPCAGSASICMCRWPHWPCNNPLGFPQVSFMSMAAAKAGGKEIDAAELSAHLALRYAGQVLTIGQQFVFEFQVRSLISALHPAAWLVVFPRACPQHGLPAQLQAAS